MKKYHITLILLLVLPFSLFANPNMQSAKLLGHKEMDFSFAIKESSDISLFIDNPLDNEDFFRALYSLPLSSAVSFSLGGTITSAFNLRAGINEWVEYQFQGGISNRYYFCPYFFYLIFFIPNFEIYAETGVKLKLFNATKCSGSLLTKAGLEFVIEPAFNYYHITPMSAAYSTKITFEVTPLFDIAKKDINKPVTHYFGFPTRLEYSLFEINHSGNVGLAQTRRSFPNLSFEFLYGIENAKHKVIVHHEFFVRYAVNTYSAFTGELSKNIFSDEWEIIGTEHLFSLGYAISLGGKTYSK
ncbi:MAG: hypothetical protein IKA37_06350 [Spirochaetales bacterium]|nr:hypothetical protein [Spirochaetales bacterium]